MSAILAAFGAGAAALDDEVVGDLLSTMARRGSDETAIARTPGALLAVARDRWEMEPGFAGPTMVASREGCHVVCDASLYYVSDLRRSLEAAGVDPASDSAADLILAAYLAFGERCVEHIEGDYAFCVWDERSQTAFCARDPFAIRSLYYMELDGSLYVASTPHPLVRRQGPRAAFDRRGLLRAMIVYPGDGSETPWQGIRDLPGAHLMQRVAGEVRRRRFWWAGSSPEWEALDFGEAAEALAGLLDRAVRERQDPEGTALAMSGGMDSTSVLACLDKGAGGVDILSYEVPEGDPANEDWYINLTASSFGLPVHWVAVRHLDFFADASARALSRSEAPGHLYESYNRALAWKARELGDRVLMNGHGGDNVFSATDVFMADLLRQGRLLHLRRYFRDRHYRGFEQAVTHVLRPALPFGIFDMLERALGRHICSRPWERPWSPWIVAEPELLREIVESHRRVHDEHVVRRYDSVLTRVRAWAMMDCVFQDICTQLFDLTRAEGVELRMPFFDSRLVRFAMSRPVDELNRPDERKLVLERSMAGRLPDRTRRPLDEGFKAGSFAGMMEACWTPQAADHLARVSGGPWISEELGLVDAATFHRTLEERGGPHWKSARDISMTLFSETWLRSWRERTNARTAADAAASRP